MRIKNQIIEKETGSAILVNKNSIYPGMNDRIRRLRRLSVESKESLSIERALITTRFFRENEGKFSVPMMRALNFMELCKHKTIYIGEVELIVGERGPFPKSVPTFPELTCHSVEDFHVLNTRDQQNYLISQEDIDTYEREVIPYWKGRTMRERIFSHVPPEWKSAYEAGLFTEFMEQRAPGHTALDGKIYRKGMLDFKREIEEQIQKLDFLNDQEATDKLEELKAMAISCDAVIVFAERHAQLAKKMAASETNPQREAELKKNCRSVSPRSGPCTAKFLGSHSNVLVCTPGYYYRVERLGRDESGTFRPAPSAFLRKRCGCRKSHPRSSQRAFKLFLDKSEQPSGAAKSGYYRP